MSEKEQSLRAGILQQVEEGIFRDALDPLPGWDGTVADPAPGTGLPDLRALMELVERFEHDPHRPPDFLIQVGPEQVWTVRLPKELRDREWRYPLFAAVVQPRMYASLKRRLAQGLTQAGYDRITESGMRIFQASLEEAHQFACELFQALHEHLPPVTQAPKPVLRDLGDPSPLLGPRIFGGHWFGRRR